MEPVPVDLLIAGPPLRLKGITVEHARMLAEVATQLPPILVHRDTMRVVDGMHRLFAAKQLKHATIDVQFIDGDEDEVFLAAISANVRHGLPLTLADRKAAATRLLRDHAEWSDRRIAALIGLSPKTVGAVRRRLTEEIPQMKARVGRDGRIRRLPERKPDAGDVPAGEHDAATSQVASVGDADTEDARSTGVPRQRGVTASQDTHDRLDALQLLSRDPAFRMSETGRFLLRLLDMHLLRVREWDRLVTNVPSHCADLVADLSWQCGNSWLEFAERVASHGTTVDQHGADSAAS